MCDGGSQGMLSRALLLLSVEPSDIYVLPQYVVDVLSKQSNLTG